MDALEKNQQLTNEVNEALVEVRKAYRLLWLFQKRVFDIFETITNEFNVNYYYSDFEKPGKPGTNPCNRPIREMLPMQQMNLLYLNNDSKHSDPSSYPQSNDFLLDLCFTADSGRDKFIAEDSSPDNFPAPEKCITTLALYLYLNKTDKVNSTNWFYQIWKPSIYPETNQMKKHDSIPDIDIYGCSFGFQELYSKSAIVDKVNIFKQGVAEKLLFNIDKR
jgi:hypothetical protein